MRLPLSHLWFTNSRFESNRSLTRTALLFVIHHYAKFATFAVCFVIIPLPYALTEYSSLQSCCSFFSTPVNSQFDLSYDHSVSDSISQLIKGLQCSQLQPLGIIVRTSFHHVCFTLLPFDKGSEFLAAQRVYLFWLCYSYVTAVCLLKYLCTQTLFAAWYARGNTHTFVRAYMLLGNKRTTYCFCISSPCNVLKWSV